VRKPETPQEKKELSLKKDRRNVYGENDKASRKAIPRRKQRGQMEMRRGVNQVLSAASLAKSRDEVDQIASNVASVELDKKRKRFKKVPDRPLGEVLKRRKPGRSAVLKNRSLDEITASRLKGR
jgi:hypothetical protein